MIDRVTLAVAVLTLFVAFFQLRSANKALDANNSFLVESTLFELGIDALEAIQEASGSDESQSMVDNAVLRYEGSLVAAKSLADDGGLNRKTWDDILTTQCGMFETSFDYFAALGEECAKR